VELGADGFRNGQSSSINCGINGAITPEITRLAVMMYVRLPLSLRNVEDLLHERGIDVSHEAARFWWHRF